MVPTTYAQTAGQSASLQKPEDHQSSAVVKNDAYYAKKRLVIKRVLERYGSPMIDSAGGFANTCRSYDIDCYLLPSIAGLESGFGKHIWPDSHNAFGWGRGFLMFDSWDDCIDAVGKGLRKKYMDKGAMTIEQIAPIYSESSTWAPRVNYFMQVFQDEEKKIDLFFSQGSVQL